LPADARRRPDPGIKRTIWFYRIFTRQDQDVIDRVDAAAICNAVRGIPRAEQYMDTGDGNGVVLAVPDGLNDRLEMLRVRFTDHPGTWENGARGDLTLRANQALTEPTFVRFFHGNIVAIDVNRSGPWPTTLRDYLVNRLREQYANFQMVQIPDRTAMQRLRQITSIRRLDFQVANATLARIPQGRHDYLDALKGAANVSGNGAIEIVWKQINIGNALNTEQLRALIQYFIEHQGDPDEKLKIEVKGSNANGDTQTFSLRRDFVHKAVVVRRTVARRIDPTDAFDKLGGAYNEVIDEFPPQRFFQ
jgi:hypothetical protein